MSAATKTRVAVTGHSIVIPETIDAIRALSGAVRDPGESIAATNATLGVGSSLV